MKINTLAAWAGIAGTLAGIIIYIASVEVRFSDLNNITELREEVSGIREVLVEVLAEQRVNEILREKGHTYPDMLDLDILEPGDPPPAPLPKVDIGREANKWAEEYMNDKVQRSRAAQEM